MFIGSTRLFTSNSLAALPLEACYNDKPFTKLDSIYATQYTHSAFKISIFEDQEKTHTLPWNILYMKLLFSLKKLKKKKKTDGTWTSHRLLLKFCFFLSHKVKAFKIIKLSLNNLPKSLTGEFFNKTFVVVVTVCKVAQSKLWKFIYRRG